MKQKTAEAAALLSASVIVASALVLVTAEDTGEREKSPRPYTQYWGFETSKTIRMPQPKPVKKPQPKPVKRSESHVNRAPVQKRKPVVQKPAKPRYDYTISSYAWCPGSAQSCIDAGKLTGYNGKYLAGHNYMGYQWLSRVPVGSIVRVTSGPLAGTYKVYGHIRLNRQGGSFPNTGGASLVLQSCEGSGTGFSLAKRV